MAPDQGTSAAIRRVASSRARSRGGAIEPADIVHRQTTRRCAGDDGGALVEFGLIAPLLFLIVFGIIDFGWAFGQWLDVRHGAREGSRLVAVNYQNPAAPHTGATQTTLDIIPATCARMDFSRGDTVSVSLPNGSAKGAVAVISVSKPLVQVTGFLQPWLNGKILSSQVQTRLERPATFTAASGTCP